MAASNDNTFFCREPPSQPSSTVASRPGYDPNSPQNGSRCRATSLDETVPPQRRPSLPPHAMSEGLSAWQASHPDATIPTLASAPSSPEHRIVNHAARSVERATDPRKRARVEGPSTWSPSSGPTLPATATAPPPMASSSSNTLEAPVASPALNRPSEEDVQMADETNASLVEHTAHLFAVFMETGVAAEVARLQNSQAKAEADHAVQEYDKNLEKNRNKTPIIHYLETRKKTAEQDYNKTSEQLASASKSFSSAAWELATFFLKHFQECTTQTSKSREQESSNRHAELRPFIERLDRLESIQANPSTGVDDHFLMSHESRFAALEASVISNHAHVMEKINASREEDRKQIDSLHNLVNDLSGQVDSLSTSMKRVLEIDPSSELEQDLRDSKKPEAQSDLKHQITQLQMDTAGLKHEVTTMRAEMQKPADPLAASSMFHDYVKRYQRNRNEDLAKLNTIAEASSATGQRLEEHETKMSSSLQAVETKIATITETSSTTSQKLEEHETKVSNSLQAVETKIMTIAESSSVTSQKLEEHETKTSSSLQAVDAKIATWEASQALLKESVASIKQDRSNQADSVPTELETEFRMTVASHSQNLNQLKLHVDGLIQLERRNKDEFSERNQQFEAWIRNMDQNLSKQVAANEHSIRALTARYNNLSSEQLAKRMAHHLNQFPNTLQVEQNSLRTRMDHLEARHHEQKITLDMLNARIREDTLRSSSDETSRQNFENRMKTEYYDVLEDKVREYRDDIRDGIESLRSGQSVINECYELLDDKVQKYHNENRDNIESLRSDVSLIKTAQKALQHHLDEIERKALLSSFQQTTSQKPSPLPEIPHQCISEPSESLSGKAECDGIINSFGKRPSDQVEDSIVVRPAQPYSRKRPR